MSGQLQESIGRLAKVVLGTTTLAVVASLCVAAHLAAGGAVPAIVDAAQACACCGAHSA